MPYFFTYAKSAKYGKGEDCSEVEEIGNGVMDRITMNIKSARLMFKSISKLEKIDYKKMLDPSWDLEYQNEELNRMFNRFNRTYGYYIDNNRVDDDEDCRKGNINFLLQQMREDLAKIEPDETKVITSLVIHMYAKERLQKKNLLWLLYGEQMYNNVKENCKDLGEICLQCGKRVDYKLYHRRCRACRNEANRNEFKKIVCCDCGQEVVVPTNSRAVRCSDCRDKHRKLYDRNRKRDEKSGVDFNEN